MNSQANNRSQPPDSIDRPALALHAAGYARTSCYMRALAWAPGSTNLPLTDSAKGALKKKLHEQPQKKERGEEAPMPRTVRGLPQTLEPGPSSRFQPPRPFERLPLCLFRKVLVVRRLSRIFPSGSSDVEENSLTPQLSSVVTRLVLEVKLYAFSLRAMATFTLFDQVSRACPWFSPLREASGRQSEICACSSVPSPAPSTEISCLQVSAKRPEPLKVSSPLTSSWAYSSALAQVSSKKAKWEVPGMEPEDDEYKPMNLTHSRIPLN